MPHSLLRSPGAARALAAVILALATAVVVPATQALPSSFLLAVNVAPVVQENEAVTLRRAYAVLARGDHDYHGHRKHAMKQIEDALKNLGTGIAGDGSGHEFQGTSDAQMQAARNLLESARAQMINDRQKRALKHVNAAIKQITVGLSIR